MRLKSLETKGFKSFADKTVINFSEDITGVIGPNGCGKSNIVDSIRWVLGEQKTSMLRSEKMENIIFNGTKKRKASSLAEVTLVFENTKNILPTEYTTVAIKRILYRNGESEYRLNDVTCRLKDITSLFIDTGISSDSYAIIELRMIDEILNDRDNSRRKLIEQAAGISKYKTRKKETLSKLNSTEGDLDRVADLLFEIESNLKELEKQARRTKKYYELKEEYKELSVDLATYTLSDYNDSFNKLAEQQKGEEDKRLKLDAQIKKIEAALEKEKSVSIEKEQKLSALQKELNEKTDKLREKENRKNLLSEKINFLNQKKDTLAYQISTANNTIKQLTEDLEQAKVKKDEEALKLKNLEASISENQKIQSDVRTAYEQSRALLEETKSAFQDIERAVFETEKQVEINTVQQSEMLASSQRDENDQEAKKKELELLKSELNKISKDKEEQGKRISQLMAENEKIKQSIVEVEVVLEKEKQTLVDQNRSLDAKRNEYDLTKSLVDNMEGFPESVKFLRKEVSATQKTPLLSDIISCKEEYRVAIENYLEPYLNYFVLKNVEEATRAINLLSEASKGRANFFLLESFEKHAAADIKIENGIKALDVIEFDDTYKNLMDYLLHNVVIVDSLKNQVENQGLVALTTNGQFIKTKHSLSGGAVGLFEGKKIGRKKNLDSLKKQISKLEETVAKLKSSIQSKENELLKLNDSLKIGAIENAKTILEQHTANYIEINTKIENFSTLLSEKLDKKSEYTDKIKELNSSKVDLTDKLKKLHLEKEKQSKKLQEQQNVFNEKSLEQEKINEQFNAANIEYHQQKNALNTIEQDIKYKEQQLENSQTQILANTNEIKDNDKEIIQVQAEVKELENLLVKLYEDKSKFEGGMTSAEENYFSAKGNINEMEANAKEIYKQREQIDFILGEFKEKVNELKLSLASMKERLSVEFNIDIDDIIDKPIKENTTQEDLLNKVERIKNRLDNYGEINPMAVEAYDEMSERHKFITEQKSDLEKAKKSLLETIEEIENVATAQFLEAFDKIRNNFIKVFHSLFSDEDKCNLTLVDENNPLESAIDIVAQPKGKRPLTINQLSGGEKTLTATALLFSLYLLKPAPFCIFDEVDAPLDDANIGKFNNIIKDFSKDSQFVIVTHNKQTMASMDVIYGVTMVEQGISRVVPVDFRALKKAS